MTVKRLAMTLAVMLGLWVNSIANPPANIKPLHVGDMVPDIVLSNMGNYKTSTARLSEFKGKLLILDFWSTWCGACINALPHMQELQQQFNGRLQVLLVNAYAADDAGKVKACFDKRRSRSGFAVTLPYSVQQTKLLAYFPHRFVPHYVWIGSNGKVIAITSRAEVTSENISAILNGQAVKLHTKNDLMEFDSNKPLFVDGNGGDGNDFSYRSIITGYQEGLGCRSGIITNDTGKITRFYMINYPALSLLRAAYPEAMIYSNKRIVFEYTDPAKFKEDAASGTRRYTNSYCYELSLPPCADTDRQKYMQEDLHRALGVRVRAEKRAVKCLVLKSGNGMDNLLTKGGEPFENLETESPIHTIRNLPTSVLTDALDELPILAGLPLLDETGIGYSIDLVFPTAFSSVEELKVFLEGAGFRVEETQRVMEVSVVYGG